MTDYNNSLLKMAESQIGYSASADGYTKFGHWFQVSHATEPGFSNAAWCDMFISWAATQVGQQDEVGQDALTIDHARWFQEQGAWGTVPRPGAVVFFSWSGAKDIDSIQHVGLVRSVINDDTIRTVEGNVSHSVVTRIRTSDKIVGYGYPDAVRTANQRKVAEAHAKAQVKPVSATGAQVGVSKSAAEQLGHPAGPVAVGGILLPVLALVAFAKKAKIDGGLMKLAPTLRSFLRDKNAR
jgi:hypothetical protein